MPLGSLTFQVAWCRLGLLLMAALLPSCNVPPCVEGELYVTLAPRIEGASNCSFDAWPGGEEFVARTVSEGDNLGYGCMGMYGKYVQPPEGSEVGGGSHGTGVPFLGIPFLTLDLIKTREGTCQFTYLTDLMFDERFPDLESAFEAQDRGEQAFYVYYGYNGLGTCEDYFPGANPGYVVTCANTHPVIVTKL